MVRILQSGPFNWVGRNISALVGCIEKLMALYEVQLLETFQIQQFNPTNSTWKKLYKDQSCENPDRHPENGTFHPTISWVYNNIM